MPSKIHTHRKHRNRIYKEKDKEIQSKYPFLEAIFEDMIKKDIEEKRRQSQEYQRNNRDRINKYNVVYKRRNLEAIERRRNYMREYQNKNRDKINKYNREYIKTYPSFYERRKQYIKQYYQNNKEKLKQYGREYYRKKKEE